MTSELAAQLDHAITPLRTVLAGAGFRARKRTFNRELSNGIIHVVQLSMGRFDPPGAPNIPGFRENGYGTFTIDLGVYVPEVAANLHHWRTVKSFPGEADCCIRRNLGELFPEGEAIAPRIDVPTSVYTGLAEYLTKYAMPFFARHADRTSIVSELRHGPKTGAGGAPRVVAAIILAAEGSLGEAKALLDEQYCLLDRSDQRVFLREIGSRLGLH